MNKVIAYLKDKNTIDIVVKTIADNILYYQGINTDEKIQSFSGSIYNQFVSECVQSNQYISLSNETIEKINQLYKDLILELRAQSCKNVSIQDVEEIVVMHRSRLLQAIEENDCQDDRDQIYIPCAEYTSDFQKKILRLLPKQILGPIMDIGCGKQFSLVKELRESGHADVYGIDQYVSNDPKIICSNWFDYYFCENTWGTILAHMSFTNHFRRVLLNNNGDRKKFTNKYNEILASLVLNGTLIYSPSLRTIEEHVDSSKYHVKYYPNTGDRDLDTVCIQRVC